MAKKDKYHEQVKEALIKEGWEITHDPYKVKLGSPTLKIDLGAEKLIAAKKGKEKIAVEIKSFISPSFFTDFYAALLLVRLFLTKKPSAEVNLIEC